MGVVQLADRHHDLLILLAEARVFKHVQCELFPSPGVAVLREAQGISDKGDAPDQVAHGKVSLEELNVGVDAVVPRVDARVMANLAHELVHESFVNLPVSLAEVEET